MENLSSTPLEPRPLSSLVSDQPSLLGRTPTLPSITKSSDEEELPDLTPAELDAIALAARREKLQRQKSDQYWQRIHQPLVMPTVDEFGSWMLSESKRYDAEGRNPRYIGPDGLVLDETNRDIFDLLCQYFVGDSRFERAGEVMQQHQESRFSLDKGIAMFGPTGCGKTTLMRLFANNPRESYRGTPCKMLANNYRTAGKPEDSERIFTSMAGRSDVNGDGFHGGTGGRCFDDLGVEPIPVVSYGNSRNLMLDLIERRYEAGRDMAGLTHLTSNLSPKLIDEIYGARVRSRMREMFNIIRFDAQTPDRRQ